MQRLAVYAIRPEASAPVGLTEPAPQLTTTSLLNLFQRERSRTIKQFAYLLVLVSRSGRVDSIMIGTSFAANSGMKL
ncbi:hypothetical protein CEN49_12000 [Fischerella thermalis CCMEE 5273]|nr:hypothetical protein CBP17_14170 [Fischerella thermalis WC114]PLZ12490.1 hypothetical protein CBP18_06385 [Fischerella thermalis WC119]PLZ17886.1 hypothetical protein CBP30_18240 [Fischerella thermalis WC157]PLZ19123.1 hypothetical protein CBP19_01575 [Fischerella thermalis WC1110]PLZ27936.1 hypothetical protein CBP29_03030 [Fischerella thermalis WC341]PLZ42498.1 hypothetical protein CBP26_07420 [Fischerella thermalis WC538]PLZ48672.1 hypothetical protein CBP25_02075 [Fischerella thermalis